MSKRKQLEATDLLFPVQHAGKLVRCIQQGTYLAALTLGKVYQVIKVDGETLHAMIRVRDDSGESFLFPAEFFEPVP